jgi:hypothetical protein
MFVEKQELQSLLADLDFPADKWDDRRMLMKARALKDVPDLDARSKKLTSPRRELLSDILLATKKGKRVRFRDSKPELDGEAPEVTEAPAKAKKKNPSTNGKAARAPGVGDTIVEVLKKASSKSPVTKEDILKTCVKRFPDRKPEAMKSTISSQVPTGLRIERKLEVKKNDNGYWL